MKSIELLIIGLSMLIVASALTPSPSDVVRKSQGSTEPIIALKGTKPLVFNSTPFAKTNIFQGKHFTALPIDDATLSKKTALSVLNASETKAFIDKLTAQRGGQAVTIGGKLRFPTTSVANTPMNVETNALINTPQNSTLDSVNRNATLNNTTINQTI